MNTQRIPQHTEAINDTFASTGVRLSYRATLIAMLMLTIAICFPKSGAAQQATATAASSGGAGNHATMRILISVLLDSSLDSKKLKSGDEVVVKMPANVALRDGSIVPRGTKVVGHVMDAKARSRGDAESSLTIRFDKFDLPDGKSVAISGMIQAVGPDLSAAYPTGGGVEYTDRMQATYAPNVSIAPRSVPVLNAQSVGVVGIKNLQLTADGVLTSGSKSVKLDSGDQVLVQVQVTIGG